MGSPMKRGEIYFAVLDPTIGSEVRKRRPVLIVSNDGNNRANDTITVLPITSNVARIYPFEVKLLRNESGLAKDSKVLAQQIRTISKRRLADKPAGALRFDIMGEVERAMRLHLALD